MFRIYFYIASDQVYYAQFRAQMLEHCFVFDVQLEQLMYEISDWSLPFDTSLGNIID